MNWERERATWPHAAHSRFVRAGPHRWHVQQMGEGADLVLIHGSGASTHSWRGLMPRLAAGRRVTAMDLPGMGFTRPGARGRAGLPETAEDLRALLAELGIARPEALVGHSAGAVIAARMALDGMAGRVVSINGAFDTFEGAAGVLFPLLAKLLAINPLTVPLFTMGTRDPARARKLLEGTGSRIDDEGLALYHRLIRDPDHVAGALAQMAAWRHVGLRGEMAAALDRSALFLAGGRDRTVPPKVSRDLVARLRAAGRAARMVEMPELGHLMHEEAPEAVARAIEAFLAEDA
jgi:magnesium chelatase accessory protein